MAYYYFLSVPNNKTIRSLCNTIIELVENNPIRDVHTNMILDKAECSKSTFYRYFPDKYALMNYIYFRDIYPLVKHVFENGVNYNTSSNNYINSAIEHYKPLYEKRDYYKKIAAIEEQNSFREFHQEFWYDYFKKIMLSYYKQTNVSVSHEFSLRVFNDGLCKITIQWLINGCTNMTIEEMAQLCEKHMTPCIRAAVTNTPPHHQQITS